MGKKIFVALCVLTLCTAAVFAILQGALFAGRFSHELRLVLQSVRVSVIDKTGMILYDNYSPVRENHSDRPELIQALQNGSGSSDRYSHTFGKRAYYVALNTGEVVIRLSLPADSMHTWIFAFLSITAVSFLLSALISLVLAKKFTAQLIEPINALDLSNTIELPYPELLPFVRKIESQKNQIRSQLVAFQHRTETSNLITENMREGLIFLDKNGLIITANQSAAAIFGERLPLASSILHVSRNAEFLKNVQDALAGKHREMIFEHGERVYHVHCSPAKVDESVNGAIILFFDATDKSIAEKQRREFSANVSHELKTPLTAISALSEMIASGLAKPADISDFAQKINTQAQRLLTLINDIIRLSEFDEARTERTFEMCNLTELAQSAAEQLAPLALERGITIAIESPAENPVLMRADRRMLEELLYNLIDNSIQYNRDGGSITVHIAKKNQSTIVSVTDTGIGISSEHIPHIFERFYRVDKSRSKKTGGTGLGLSIVKHIAEVHGGSVSIESEFGRGTTITCAL